MSLDDIRDEINRLDDAIVRLLDERARAGREIGRLKKSMGLPFHNPEREREVLARLRAKSDGSMPAPALDAIYRTVMAETLAMQVADASAPASGCGGHAPSAKHDVAALVAGNVEVAPGFFRMRLRAPELAGVFEPGQFFQIRIGSGADGFFLRRPFAPSAYEDDGLSFVYGVVGSGTSHMSRLAVGSVVNVLAPLGNAYRLPASPGHALLVGGGCGAPSLATLAARLKATGGKVTAVMGARTSAVLLEYETFSKVADRLIVATDDGSHGCHGNAIDAFRTERESIGAIDGIYACGPTPMLKAVAALAEELKVECQVSLEERMACGFGACMGCAVLAKDGKGGTAYRRVCHDGPVFDAKNLAWER